MMLEDGIDDAQAEIDDLRPDLQPEERAAVADLVRALFSVGSSPEEANAVLTEI